MHPVSSYNTMATKDTFTKLNVVYVDEFYLPGSNSSTLFIVVIQHCNYRVLVRLSAYLPICILCFYVSVLSVFIDICVCKHGNTETLCFRS